eukprot:3213449-Rhodomonas_salina.3
MAFAAAPRKLTEICSWYNDCTMILSNEEYLERHLGTRWEEHVPCWRLVPTLLLLQQFTVRIRTCTRTEDEARPHDGDVRRRCPGHGWQHWFGPGVGRQRWPRPEPTGRMGKDGGLRTREREVAVAQQAGPGRSPPAAGPA